MDASTLASVLAPHNIGQASLDHLDPYKLPNGYSEWKNLPGKGKYAVLEREIKKSPNDDREYRIIRLENGLEAVLVKDAAADKAAAAVSVRVGHLSDPEDLPGLAHYCEHLSFMGTEKHPDENYYAEYLAQNSGRSNAFTGMDQTVYYFDVHPPALTGALDCFSRFFIDPLFAESTAEREVQAVNSENQKNLQNDTWRLYQLEKYVSSRDHAYWRFGTGNLQTLWDIPKSKGLDTRTELLKWHKQHYSSNLMKLAVCSNHSLDELTAMVVEFFEPAVNRNLPPPLWPGNPLTPKETKKHIFVKSVKERRTMEFAFPFPDQSPLFDTKPGNIITHFVGHEGPGSILSFIKKVGWANGLSAGSGTGCYGWDFFKINIDLTKEGLDHHEDVARVVFAYISLLKKNPPSEWAFNEVQMLNEIGFQFLEKSKPSSYVTSLCSQLQEPFPREALLSAPWLCTKWDPEAVKQSLEGLTPENAKITIACQEKLGDLEWDQSEPYYSTEYRIADLSEKVLQPASDEEIATAELALPEANPFIPDNLNLLGKYTEQYSKEPKLIQETEGSRLWFKQDDRWKVPRASCNFYLRSPIVNSSPRTANLLRLYLNLVSDALTEYSYDASLAGLGYKFDVTGDGVVAGFDGYNAKLSVFSKVILDRFRNLIIDPARFAIVKDKVRRALENFAYEAPITHSTFNSSYILVERVNMPADRLAAIHDITVEDVKAFGDELFSKMDIEGLVIGNIAQEDAIDLAGSVDAIIKSKPLSKEEKLSTRSRIPVGPTNISVRRIMPDPQNVNSTLEHFWYCGNDMDDDTRQKVTLLEKIMHEPVFDVLRTKEQLGYMVGSGVRSAIGLCGIRIGIQSDRHPDYLEQRVRAFEDHFQQLLGEWSEERFDKEKTSLINKLKEDHKNLWGEAGHYWEYIQAGYYDFHRELRDIEGISKLTKNDILTYFNEKCHHASPTRQKLAIQIQSQLVSVAALTELGGLLVELTGLPPNAELQANFAKNRPNWDQLRTTIKAALEEAKMDYDKIKAAMDHIENAQNPPVPEGVKFFRELDDVVALLVPGPYATPVEGSLKKA